MNHELVEIIKKNLDSSLLKRQYIEINSSNYLYGHCYIASEAYFHLSPQIEKKYLKPSILKVGNITHWYLTDTRTDEIIDITAKQFNFELDYSKGKRIGFLTKNPSKRCIILINKINETN